jgi:UDPglucose 6-dehydrogenase/GDP-mannose 6-dehydrogenase
MNPDRIVIGAIDEYSAEIIRELYSDFSDSVIIKTNPHTAEMIKYTANSLLATFISFANEVANLCSVTPSVDVSEVMEAVVLDRRISLTLPDGRKVTPGMSSYLNAGCGFGGSCFPKDVRALIAHARQSKVEMQILDAVMRTNDTQPERMLNLLDKHIELNTGDKVTVLGLSFKPGTNDIRESPALIIINHLLGRGAAVTVYDPVALNDAAAKFEGKAIRFGTSLVDALRDARAVLLVTHWPEFEPISELISRMEPTPILIDGRRFIEPSSVPLYDGIGIGPAFSNLGVS